MLPTSADIYFWRLNGDHVACYLQQYYFQAFFLNLQIYDCFLTWSNESCFQNYFYKMCNINVRWRRGHVFRIAFTQHIGAACITCVGSVLPASLKYKTH